MTPIGKWFNRPRRNSSPTRAALTEYMNISSSRNNTFPPTNNNNTAPQRAPMLITSSFYNQEYPFEIYDSSAAEEEEQGIAVAEPVTPVEPTVMYNQQNFVQEPTHYVSTQPNINIIPHHHHDEIYYTREPYRATNERAPTPFTSSERYTDTTEDPCNGKTFSIKDLADFEKLQNDFKKLERKYKKEEKMHKKKEKKIQELEYLLYSKNMETQPVPVPKPNHGYRSFDSNNRPPVIPNSQYTRSFDIPYSKPTSAPKLTNSYQSYYEPYYAYGQDYYYANHTPSLYYYPSSSLDTSNRHTNSTQHRYSFDIGPEENDDAMLRNYYLRYYHGRRPTT